MPDASDPFDLARFVAAQESVYGDVVAELSRGRKATHWMWFIFPQIRGLGHSALAVRYAISGAEEARAYLDHPLLGARLTECTLLVLRAAVAPDARAISAIFGAPDDLKFHSSMTLFDAVASRDGAAAPDNVFAAALQRCFAGRRDAATLATLRQG
jgi:uncharacterized protein (DUF1810 family)